MKISKTSLHASLFSLFSFFNQGVSFVLLIILANYISPTEYGDLSLFNTVITFLGYFIAMSTTGYESISYFKKNYNEYRSDFTAIHIISCFIFFCLIIILLIFGKQLAVLVSLTQKLLYLAIIISFTSTFTTLTLSYFRVKQDIVKFGIISCGNALINFALTLFFILYLKYDWEGRVYSNLWTNIILLIFAVIIYIKNRLIYFNKLSKQRFIDILRWGIPLIPHMGAIWIRQGLDRYIIDYYHSTADVGLFSFALNLVNIIIIIGSSFNNVWSVEVYKTLSFKVTSSNKKDILLKKSKQATFIFLGITILIVICVSIFVPIILPKYNGSITYFCILSGYGFIQCLYFLVVNYLFYYKKNKDIMFTTFGTSILHLLLSLIFTPYSLYLTCAIYVIIQAIIVSILYFRTKKVLRYNWYNT